MKRLTLIRHAKSSWKKAFETDFERPLSGRGKGDAPEIGRRLAKRGFRPDLVVSSPARRALKTARIVAGELGLSRDAIVEEMRMYEASSGELMEVVAGLGDGAGHALLFGHNPGFTDLAERLTGRRIVNVPTCGVVDMQFAVSRWREVRFGEGELLLFDYPKNDGT